MKFIYPAILSKQEDGRYTAMVPDLEGCTASGDSLDEVMEEANAAVLTWITLELEEEASLPPVSDISDLVLKENEFVRNVCVTYRMTDGWEE